MRARPLLTDGEWQRNGLHGAEPREDAGPLEDTKVAAKIHEQIREEVAKAGRYQEDIHHARVSADAAGRITCSIFMALTNSPAIRKNHGGSCSHAHAQVCSYGGSVYNTRWDLECPSGSQCRST